MKILVYSYTKNDVIQVLIQYLKVTVAASILISVSTTRFTSKIQLRVLFLEC